MVTDSHCHLTHARFDHDRASALERALDADVRRIVTIASDAHDAGLAAALARDVPQVWATAGVHPHEVGRAVPEDLARVEELLSEPRVVAVGETGLDYYYDNAPRDLQRRWFASHLEVGARHGLPVVVHARRADDDVAELITRFRGAVRGVLHCFTGGRDLLRTALDAGWYVGYGGIVTFRSFDAEDLLRQVPADRLLVETDAPYLAPVPERGKRNEPAFVTHSLARIADLRGVPVEQLAVATSRNASELFGLPPVEGA